MKKFLIAAITVMLLLILGYTAYYKWGFYFDFNDNRQVSSFTATQGKEILVDTGQGLEAFEIRGINMGAGIPAHFATEYPINKETYLRWFAQIQEMGANTIRVYTILSSDFYEAVYEYNTGRDNPLYILHGVWVNDYVQNSHVDAYDDSFLKTFQEDCRTLVDILHGRKYLQLGYGTTSANGSYTKDISPWVLGYILGVEWEDVTVAYTNQMQEDRSRYAGKYMYTSEDASPFEAMLAEAGDSIIDYETRKYKTQRLVAFSNWPTTDPFEYDEETTRLFLKCAQVNVEHILTTDAFLSGQFASYHAYPYYPDYLQYDKEMRNSLTYAEQYRQEDGLYNTYGMYLKMLNTFHTMPVVIAEFGVPASRGRAQVDFHTGRSQGYMTEQEQGAAIVESYGDIVEAGCAGSIIFTWQDEWFKRTWNTMANVDLVKTAYWSDYQTNEQYFGLLSFDPGRERSICYVDGDVDEWTQSDEVLQNAGYTLSMKYDEKFIYLRINKEGLTLQDKLYIPFDITPESGSYYAEEEEIRFDRQADFLLILDGRDNSRILVQERYNAFQVIFAEDYGESNPFFNPPDQDSPIFEPIYLALQIGNQYAVQDNRRLLEKFETGKLTYGNANPDAEDYNSVADFYQKGSNVEIRLPWQLLNFSNPSEMQIHDDYYKYYGIEYRKIDEIYAGVGAEGSNARIPMESFRLKGWGKNPTYHERLKKSYYIVQKAWNSQQQENLQ